MMSIPTLRDGPVTIRPIRLRDARALEQELISNRAWLRTWEATNPHGPIGFDSRASIRSLLSNWRSGFGVPFVIEYEGEFDSSKITMKRWAEFERDRRVRNNYWGSAENVVGGGGQQPHGGHGPYDGGYYSDA